MDKHEPQGLEFTDLLTRLLMKPRSLSLISFLLFLLFFGLWVRPVEAHASLSQSLPEANAQLAEPPVQIELYFSEAIEPTFSTIEVLDSNGKRVDNDDSLVDQADPTRLTASLRSMPDGIYTVSWRVLSAVDGHITAGAYPFAVGAVDAAALEAAGRASTQVKVAPGEIVTRWLTFLSVMTLVGGMFFLWLVWRPAIKMTDQRESIQPPWMRVSNVAILILFLASFLWLLLQAGQASGQEFAWPWEPVLSEILFTTRFGALWLARIVFALVLLWLLPQASSGWQRWVALVAGLLMLLTISLGSHAAAQPEPVLPVLSDWLHLTAASIWVGGLIYFLVGILTLRHLEQIKRRRFTVVLIPKFSALALVSVGILVLTGLYATILHVGSFEALVSTTYGRVLLLKLFLILPMLILGAINLLVTRPGMKESEPTGGEKVSRFRRLVSSEVTLGIAVLLSVGILTTLPPAQANVAEPMLSGTEEVEDLQLSLVVSPGRPGLNTFTVTALANGQPLEGAKEVALQFTPATVDLPPSSVQLAEKGDGEYGIEGGYLALPDLWQVQAVVRRDNAFDAFANFNLNVGTATVPGASSQNFPWYWLTGGLLLAAAGLLLLALASMTKSRRQRLVFGGFPAFVLIIVALAVFLNPPGEAAEIVVNPIAPNADSIAIGQELYLQNCVPCHGLTGAGDGPVGRTLNPPPADLTAHTAPGVHPDSRLYDWITNGFADSVMPAFSEQMTDDERWHVVNYIRTLSQP